MSRKNAPWMGPNLRRKLVTIFGRGIEGESWKRQNMEVISYRLFLEQSRVSKVSCRWESTNSFGGIVLDASCGVWWMDSTAMRNGDGFVSVGQEEAAEKEGHSSQLGCQYFA